MTYQEYEQLIRELSKKISSSPMKFDGIVALSRGGLPVAVALSHALDLPIAEIIMTRSYHGHKQGELEIMSWAKDEDIELSKPLIVDEINDTGSTLEKISGFYNKAKTAVLVQKPTTKFSSDFFVTETQDWVIFPWETS